MVTPPPLRHVYHRLLRWQSVFSSPSPSIGSAAQNTADSDIRATVCLEIGAIAPDRAETFAQHPRKATSPPIAGPVRIGSLVGRSDPSPMPDAQPRRLPP